MDQHANKLCKEVSLYLQSVGMRPSTKGYQYLCFALTQLLQGTPFQNTIWAVTAIHFNQTRRNVLQCVRREIRNAFTKNPERFVEKQLKSSISNAPPKIDDFLWLSWASIVENKVV